MQIPKDWFPLLSLLISKFVIIFGPAFPYIPQHIENSQTHTADGFSIYVSLIQVLSASLKIAYWFGRSYDFSMFLQNFVTIFSVMMMIDQYIAIENKRWNRTFDERNFIDFEISWFWRWTDIISYVQATAYFLTVTCCFSVFFSWIPHYFDVLTFIILFLDSSVSLPQLWHNFSRKTTYGLNKSMVSMWNIYDIYKLVYMISVDSPWPFKVNGIIQLIIDSGILAQIFYYGDRPKLN